MPNRVFPWVDIDPYQGLLDGTVLEDKRELFFLSVNAFVWADIIAGAQSGQEHRRQPISSTDPLLPGLIDPGAISCDYECSHDGNQRHLTALEASMAEQTAQRQIDRCQFPDKASAIRPDIQRTPAPSSCYQ